MAVNKAIVRGAGAVAMVAALAACSSSSKSSTSSTTPTGSGGSTSTTAAAPTGTPIDIGFICSCTGPFGTNINAAGEVAKDWAQAANVAGGLAGHQVHLITEDDGGTPGTSVTDVQTLINDKVAVIIDDTPLDVAWAKTVSAANIPVVGGNFSSTPFYTDPDWYPSGQTNDSITYSNVSVAKVAGATNIGDLYCAEAPQCQESVPLIKTAGTQLAVPAVYSASVAMTAPNYTAQCLAAQQQKVTSVFIGDSAATIQRIATDCDKQGYDPVYVTEGTGFSLSMASTAGLKDHLWNNFPIRPFWDDSAPEVKALDTVVDKYSPGLRTNQLAWTGFAAQTWTATLLLEHALKNAAVAPSDTVTAATFKKGLDMVSNDNLDGWSPTLNFTAGQPHKVDCWFVARVQGGTPSLVNGGQLSCQS